MNHLELYYIQSLTFQKKLIIQILKQVESFLKSCMEKNAVNSMFIENAVNSMFIESDGLMI